MKIKKGFGMTFQKYRLENNMTQESLAKVIGKSANTISQIETAKDRNK